MFFRKSFLFSNKNPSQHSFPKCFPKNGLSIWLPKMLSQPYPKIGSQNVCPKVPSQNHELYIPSPFAQNVAASSGMWQPFTGTTQAQWREWNIRHGPDFPFRSSAVKRPRRLFGMSMHRYRTALKHVQKKKKIRADKLAAWLDRQKSM